MVHSALGERRRLHSVRSAFGAAHLVPATRLACLSSNLGVGFGLEAGAALLSCLIFLGFGEEFLSQTPS